MSQKEKKRVADEVIEKSIELYGLSPDEISDKNEEWMINQGYKRGSPQNWSAESTKPITKQSQLERLLNYLRER